MTKIYKTQKCSRETKDLYNYGYSREKNRGKKSVKHTVEKSIKYNVSIAKKNIDFFSQHLLSTMFQRKGKTYFSRQGLEKRHTHRD